MTATTPLDDIDETTPRPVLIQRIRDYAAQLHGKQDARLARFQEIEERVRKDYAGRHQDVVALVVHGTPQEWQDAANFLGEFEDFLPIVLHRIATGAKQATDDVTTNQ